FAERNNSNVYSDKLYKRLNNALKSLDKQPDLGIRTEIDAVRGLIVGNYIIFYECTQDKIIVHTLWDSRQNPEKLNIK
ncbi:MAG: type II toxin-antitoxin system RelE/ParE family toxin, partial [Bacteroidota bacterium]